MTTSTKETALEEFEFTEGYRPDELRVRVSQAISTKRIADALEGIELMLEKIYRNMPEPRE